MIGTDKPTRVSLEEFMQLPEATIQLIDGQIVNEPAPGYGHQQISINISGELYGRLKQNKKGQIISAPQDVVLGENVIQPDLLFIAAERMDIVKEGKVQEAPDVVFEIISPSNAYYDTKVKFDIYERFGVKEYFIVYPEDKTVVKYVLTDGKFHEESREVGFIRSGLMACEITF